MNCREEEHEHGEIRTKTTLQNTNISIELGTHFIFILKDICIGMIVCPCCHVHIPFNSAVEKFWAQVDKLGPIPERCPELGACWVWVGNLDQRGGYGRLSLKIGAHDAFPKGKQNIMAHRYSYLLEYGEIPEGMLVRHKCDNPPCVNPKHLELGTNEDNMRDRKERGRYALGENSARSVLTEEQVITLRAEAIPGKIGYKQLAKKYNLNPHTVQSVLRRQTWKHLP